MCFAFCCCHFVWLNAASYYKVSLTMYWEIDSHQKGPFVIPPPIEYDKSILRSFAQMTSSAISTVAEPSVFCGPSLCTADHNGCAVISDDTVHVLLSDKQWWALFSWQMGYLWARDAILYHLLCLCLAKMFTLRWWFYELVPLYGASLCWCICLEYKRQFDFFHCHSDCSDQNCV